MSSNKKEHKRLSINELKKFKGLEYLSDEQAEESIKSLESISILIFEMYKKNKLLKEKINKSNNEETK